MSRFTDFLDVYMEGEQAEEYKRRKEEEQRKEDDKTIKRFDVIPTRSNMTEKEKEDQQFRHDRGRVGGGIVTNSDGRGYTYSDPGAKFTKDNPNSKPSKMLRHPIKASRSIEDDWDRQGKASKIVDDHLKNKSYGDADKLYARDAANRHIRRHPEAHKESTIWENMFI